MKYWQNRPYYSIGDYYREKFGESVYKASVSVADTCPNRLGLKGMQTCTFCDVWGSAAYADQTEFSLENQIKNVQAKLQDMSNVKKFVVYFQSYTNSFMAISKLRSMYEEALKFPNVVGIVIGTRPDCISQSLLNLWKEFSERTYVSIEFGAQSFYEDFLEFEKRGHTAQSTIDAVYKVSEIKTIDLGLHFIFGHPDETPEHAKEQALFASSLPISSVKLHNLHVLKATKLEKYYEQGLFKPMELEEYSELVGTFIQYLPEHIAVQRLSALSSRWEELIAPEWTKRKMTVFQAIISHMNAHKRYQSELYTPQPQTRVLPEHFKAKIIDQTPFEEVLRSLKENPHSAATFQTL